RHRPREGRAAAHGLPSAHRLRPEADGQAAVLSGADELARRSRAARATRARGVAAGSLTHDMHKEKGETRQGLPAPRRAGLHSMSALRIDCDIHPPTPRMSDLLPHLSDYWRETVVNRGIGDLELADYATEAPISCRSDWRNIGKAPSLPWFQAHALDAF